MEEQRSFLSAVKWAYSLYWGGKGISAVVFFLLAGLLGPKDFGTVAIATIYITFLQLFLDQGLATALIQRRNLEQEHLNAVFWVNLAFSLALVLISFLFSRLWAAFNHAPEVSSVIRILSLSIVIEALSTVQAALLQREMNYRTLSIRTNLSVLVSGIVGIALAFSGFGVWSLVSQQLLKDILSLVLLWRLSSWRPSFRFSWRALKELLSFSVPHFFSQLASFVDTQLASVVLGAFFGPIAVGLYKFVERAVATVVSMSSGSIHIVTFSMFSRLQDNLVNLQKSVLTSLRMSSAASLPALAGLAVTSDPLMAAIGASWVPASDALKVLCVSGAAMILASFTSPLIQALGNPQHSAILEWGRVIAGIAALIAAALLVQNSPIQDQVLGIAMARLFIAVLLVFPIFVHILLKLSSIPFRDFITATFPSILASIAVVLSVELFRHFAMTAESRPTIALAQEIAVGGVAGLTTLAFADERARSFVSMVAKKTISQLSTKAPQ
jgi:O-antigen/teichoic acid export membrane protein